VIDGSRIGSAESEAAIAVAKPDSLATEVKN
jgi:hypothetical protein